MARKFHLVVQVEAPWAEVQQESVFLLIAEVMEASTLVQEDRAMTLEESVVSLEVLKWKELAMKAEIQVWAMKTEELVVFQETEVWTLVVLQVHPRYLTYYPHYLALVEMVAQVVLAPSSSFSSFSFSLL